MKVAGKVPWPWPGMVGSKRISASVMELPSGESNSSCQVLSPRFTGLGIADAILMVVVPSSVV